MHVYDKYASCESFLSVTTQKPAVKSVHRQQAKRDPA